jgi:hypothetical protein
MDTAEHNKEDTVIWHRQQWSICLQHVNVYMYSPNQIVSSGNFIVFPKLEEGKVFQVFRHTAPERD